MERRQGKLEERHKAGEAVQAARGADAEHVPQDHQQVSHRHLKQVAFRDRYQAPQPSASRAAGFADVGETAFVQFTPFLVQRFVENSKERLPEFPTQLPLNLLRPIVMCASNPGD